MAVTAEEDTRSLDTNEETQEIADVLTKLDNQTLDLTGEEREIFKKHVNDYNIANELLKIK